MKLSRETIIPGDRSIVSIDGLTTAIRDGGDPTDDAFDRYLPDDLRAASAVHWTPLAVAARAAAWIAELDIESVVDLGSGAGKFCVAVALAGRCRFIGIEQRERLVVAARHLATQFHVADRVRFVVGTVTPTSVPIADAYYLYNPFGENHLVGKDRLDDAVESSDDRYEHDIGIVEELLRRARKGTYVLTYNGFGGRMPKGYDQIRVDRRLPNMLRLWEKTRASGERRTTAPIAEGDP